MPQFSHAVSAAVTTLALLAAGTALGRPAPIFQLAVSPQTAPSMADIRKPADATSQGAWSITEPWPLNGLSLTVMPDGRVLSYGAPPGQTYQDGRAFDLWDEALGFAPSSHLIIADGQLVDSFCSSATIMPSTGDVLVSGGASTTSGYSAFASAVVHPAASTAVNAGFNLAAQRWYGTMSTLADGRMLMTGGSTPYAVVNAYADPSGTLPDISVTPEIFTPGAGWSSLMGATSTDAFGPVNNRAWYPRQWVAPNGQVFGISTDNMWLLDPVADTISTIGPFKTTVNTATLPNVGPTSTAVMYDVGKIMQAGGNGYNNGYPSPSSPYATLFDITNPAAPVVQDTAPMNYPRQWANSLVLPDGQVLVTGGSTYADQNGSNAVYAAEIWNPGSGQWTVGASAGNYRGYHSSTALLPSGVVLSTGGGSPGPVTNLNAELYFPPYFFTYNANGQVVFAARPDIVSLNTTTVHYGKKITVQMGDSSAIPAASLIGLSTVTHAFNTFQRRLKLTFTQSGPVLKLTMPASANLAPPGYYMLTVLNGAGVPSPGVIVALNAAPVPQKDVTAILPVDGAYRSIASTVSPGSVITLNGLQAVMAPVSPQSPIASRDAASFATRPGLANRACYSFQSKADPGYYLTGSATALVAGANTGSTAFAHASTFCAVAGISGTGYSLQPLTNKTLYVHNRGAAMGLDANDGSAAFAAAASFTVAQQYLPTDATLHSFANLAQAGALVRHRNFIGYVTYLNSAASAGDMADSSFSVVPGLAGAGCYAIEASNYPGYFLRQSSLSIALNQNDGSAQFASDATFCLQQSLSGTGFALTNYGLPGDYVRQSGGQLYMAANDGSAQFAQDSTFTLVPAQ